MERSWQRRVPWWGWVLIGVGILLAIAPLRVWLNLLYRTLSVTWQTTTDLIGIAILGLLLAAMLAPLEALSWWAGWYGDDRIDQERRGELAEPIADLQGVRRFVVYLDGIGQAGYSYLPEGEAFLHQLAETLPDEIAIIRGIMPYSVLNRSLTEDRWLSRFWVWADRLRLKNPKNLLGTFINLRNMLTVAVSADTRYGPIYNQGVAEVIYDSLMANGYRLGSGIPLTLVGFSGGGQISVGVAPILKRRLNAPVDIISLGGVIAGNGNLLEVEHLYHLVGEKDTVERLGPMLFPRRWPALFLSHWNRAKRRGKISLISLGPVGHEIPGGVMDPESFLPDGRSYLDQTVDWVADLLLGRAAIAADLQRRKLGDYDRCQQAWFNRPQDFPRGVALLPELYQPVGDWVGRLVLPAAEARSPDGGVGFVLHHAPEHYDWAIGQQVWLTWDDRHPEVASYRRAATCDVHFNAEARYSTRQGMVHPERLNHWQQVDPLESLAGAHPEDDVVVVLRGAVTVDVLPAPAQPAGRTLRLHIAQEPAQLSGGFYTLARILGPIAPGSDRYTIVHFNRVTRAFDGLEAVVRIPDVVPGSYGLRPTSAEGWVRSPHNDAGWYLYGDPDADHTFVVKAVAPRSLLRVEPDDVRSGRKAAQDYVLRGAWADIATQPGRAASMLLDPEAVLPSEAIARWQQVGKRALLIHVYGGMGGPKPEPATQGPIYFGHFAYGLATVVRDPLADELRFEIDYFQIYAHNENGILSAVTHWSRYMGDRQYGFLGTRPVCDLLLDLPAFTGTYEFDLPNGTTVQRSPLAIILRHLETMMARYRVGDGTGGAYVGPANNCAQDSNQALYAALQSIEQAIAAQADYLQAWRSRHPQDARRFDRLLRLKRSLNRDIVGSHLVRSDWDAAWGSFGRKGKPGTDLADTFRLGIAIDDHPIRNLIRGLGSWRTMFPRVASDTIARNFLAQQTHIWVLRTTQVGSGGSSLAPVIPFNFATWGKTHPSTPTPRT